MALCLDNPNGYTRKVDGSPVTRPAGLLKGMKREGRPCNYRIYEQGFSSYRN